MLKLDMGIWSVKLSKFEKIFFHFLIFKNYIPYIEHAQLIKRTLPQENRCVLEALTLSMQAPDCRAFTYDSV